MRYDYVVYLKRDGRRSLNAVGIFLCLFSTLCFLYEQVRSERLNYFLTSVVLVLLAGVTANIILSRRKKRVRYRTLLLIAALGWLGMPFLQWHCVVYVLFAFLDDQIRRPLEIGFSPDKVVINSLWRRHFTWEAFTNVILKEGILTLDFKNNRLLQKEVDEEEDGDADEDEFNAFCRDRLRNATKPSTG